ncbi:excinuclease ABC subunit UvrC [Halosquirtibacter xylanolyticus]|uniref:excinuclease ABC subunit UvrC n=1 Tax=Halosquirtibacter xylanolyticus TaxID=3374599 RepID=UPI0037499E8D|nr:excinuclease ABC subunit UvrC [Prolixibacteraceae bacterium]
MVDPSYKNQLKDKIKLLPSEPGVYQYFDKDGTIIYIGKAKNLKKRVSSYFNKSHDNLKTEILVRKIYSLQHIVVETEEDALLLENNLIKKYKPKYNILLKDDKSYPWICVSNENFPRVFITRNVIKDGSIYYGPYTSTSMVRALIDLIHQIFKLRNCKFKLTKENIESGKFDICLEYHIKNCKGPCEGYYSEDDYNLDIQRVKHILSGNLGEVLEYLRDTMIKLSEELRFEEANDFKQKFELLNNYKSKSTIVSAKIKDIDVFTVDMDDKSGYVNFIKVKNGAIIQSYTLEYKKKLDESLEEILEKGIIDIRQRFFSVSREILIPFEIGFSLEGVKFIVPQIGDKKKLLDLSNRNVKYYKLEQKKVRSLKNPEIKSDLLLEKIKKDLQLNKLPRHIECFDNSNIQGHYPVAACVVFKNGKPSKKDYRHFNIKTVEGPNDFASMEEIIYRRYHRLINDNLPLPDVIVIDGGKGQLSAAVKILRELEIINKVCVIGLAKRLEEIFFPGDPIPLYLDKKSETLRVIQHLRDEAHRFGITFHRNQRSKGFISSELDSISGVGPKTKEALLTHFRSVAAIKSASQDQLQQLIGNNKGQLVFDHFNK